MEIEQNQTFLHGTYSNLTLFFIGCKILKYFSDFYNWHFSLQIHFSVSFQKWPETGKVKLNLYLNRYLTGF